MRALVVVMVWLALLAITAPAQVLAQMHVRTTSTPARVWLHELGADGWTDLCPAPCETEVTNGSALGLSLEGLAPQRVGPVTLTDGAWLRLAYEDHHLTRTYGLIVTVIGVVAALTLGLGGATAWISAGGVGDMTGPVTAMVSAGAALAVGLSIGIVLLNEGDHIAITLAP